MSAISIAARYTAAMRARQSLPLLWLLSDARNDAHLDRALRLIPPGSGFVYRHYHLDPARRQARFDDLKALVTMAGWGHRVILADTPALARAWGADGVYGDARRVANVAGMLKLATAHDGDELAAAVHAGADGVFLSPVFATRSHPQAAPLGVHGFHVLAQQSPVPVIALGGMTHERAAELGWSRWGAIDGLIGPSAP